MNQEEIEEKLFRPLVEAGWGYQPTDPKPEVLLFHFTDAAGLMGILQNKTLWATRASYMNDSRELIHGMNLGKSVMEGLMKSEVSRFTLTWETALKRLEDGWLNADAYVTSFCPKTDESVHWLSYGRGGYGYAIGIDFTLLDQTDWTLVPVIYDEEKQRQFLREVYDRIITKADELEKHYGISSGIEQIVGQAIVGMTSYYTPRFKHSSFAAEEEWRLFRTRFVDTRVDKLCLKFRAHRDGVLPYTEFPMKLEAIKKIVMGSQLPGSRAEQSLKLLLRQHEVENCEIVWSDVPVREPPR